MKILKIVSRKNFLLHEVLIQPGASYQKLTLSKKGSRLGTTVIGPPTKEGLDLVIHPILSACPLICRSVCTSFPQKTHKHLLLSGTRMEHVFKLTFALGNINLSVFKTQKLL